MEDNEKKLTSQTEGETIEDNDDNQYEHICYVCRRPESKAGKMITISPDITICNDCMQKAFNQVNSGNFPKMFGIPEGFPFAGMPDDLMNMMSGMNMGMPEKQKILMAQDVFF